MDRDGATTATYSDAELVDQLTTRRIERLRKGWKAYQPRNPIASDLSDCRRYQVVRIIGWQVREVPDDDGLGTIEQGNVMEPAVISQLQAEGWEVVETQSPFEIRQPIEQGGPPKTIIRGKIDGKLRIGKELIPFDAKDTSEWTLDGIECEADLEHSVWTRKWRRQMQTYMLGENYERSLLYLSFRGRRKPIPLRLDYDLAEDILQTCAWAVKLTEELLDAGVTHETVNDALAEREVPYHDAYSVCRSCPFRDRACFPPQPSEKQSQLRPDLEAAVTQYLATQPHKSQHEKLRRLIKAETEGIEQTVAGRFVVTGEWKDRRMKAQPAKEAHVQTYWSFGVTEIGPHEEQSPATEIPKENQSKPSDEEDRLL